MTYLTKIYEIDGDFGLEHENILSFCDFPNPLSSDWLDTLEFIAGMTFDCLFDI